MSAPVGDAHRLHRTATELPPATPVSTLGTMSPFQTVHPVAQIEVWVIVEGVTVAAAATVLPSPRSRARSRNSQFLAHSRHVEAPLRATQFEGASHNDERPYHEPIDDADASEEPQPAAVDELDRREIDHDVLRSSAIESSTCRLEASTFERSTSPVRRTRKHLSSSSACVK